MQAPELQFVNVLNNMYTYIYIYICVSKVFPLMALNDYEAKH